MEPERLVVRFIEKGIPEADASLALECDPLAPIPVDDYDATTSLDKMTLAEIDRVEEQTGDFIQRAIYAEQCLADWRKRKRRTEAA